MAIISGFLFFLYVFAQLVAGAPIRMGLLMPGSTIADDDLNISALDNYPHPDSAPVLSSMDDWAIFRSPNGRSDFSSIAPTLEFFPTDYDLGRTDLAQIPGMNVDVLPTEQMDLVIRSPDDLVVHPRDVAALDKASKGLDAAGEITNKIAKAADAIPEVGEIIGTAIQVVSYVMKAIAKLLDGVKEAEIESARQRGEFTKKVTDDALKKHPGWLIVTVHPKHTTFFQGHEHADWAHDTTFITTKVGIFKFHVYSARAGIFINDGDGGYQNWAYSAPADKLQSYGDQGHRLV
ncbi:hypothetical protein J3R30DRAFT_3438647 [Lentinula aciculospora]|uniref:Uncharacterized protein n=1 Tax=Lentinula aciculospora TaxID=153920 RepID=A0A9W9AL44_9AGAR|nr:hypothetical protein J3R30DRAFT_3438647 [Lentinula aciculospora]